MRLLGPGNAVAAGTAHASFNVGRGRARLLAVSGPCVGEGFTTVIMAAGAPWSGLRAEARGPAKAVPGAAAPPRDVGSLYSPRILASSAWIASTTSGPIVGACFS